MLRTSQDGPASGKARNNFLLGGIAIFALTWAYFDYVDNGRPRDTKKSTLMRWWYGHLILMLAAIMIGVALKTVSSIHSQYKPWFDAFEVFSIIVFSIEYLCRLWACVEDERYADSAWPRLRYALSAMALIDLIAILPFFLGLFFAVDLRILRVLRLLRVFKLTRYSSAMNLLLDVFRDEAKSLLAGFFILFVLLVLAASGAYLAEHIAQNHWVSAARKHRPFRKNSSTESGGSKPASVQTAVMFFS